MSIDYDLYKVPQVTVPSEMLEAIPFGSQQEIIDRLCSILGFSLTSENSPSATIFYQYHHESDCGRVIQYRIHGDPVSSISINRALPEDLLPVVDVLGDLAPFVIVSSVDGLTNLYQLFYTFID